jgi:hypothetical protein
MNRLVSLVLVVGGIVLIVHGVRSSDSISSEFSRFVTGTPTDNAMWMILGGCVAVIVGSGGVFIGSKAS